MDSKIFKYAVIGNIATVMACALCVTGLAYFTDGYWGWGFVLMVNLNSVSVAKG